MNTTTLTAASLVLGLALAAPVIGADPVAEPGKDKQAELEEKVKSLEKRVQQLEKMLEREGREGRDGAGGEIRRRWVFPDGDGGLNELFERLQRDMQRGPGDMGDLNLQFGPRGFVQRKPRLGVELSPSSAELRERFRNDAKECAFVMSVVPGSPAEKAGMNVGDAVTAFNGKAVASPGDLIDAVRAAPAGKNEISVTRQNEAKTLQVELGEAPPDEQAMDFQRQRPGQDAERGRRQDGWLRREDANPGERGQMEIQASALEAGDELAKTLKLTDEQRKKMSEVLGKHSRLLNEEVAADVNLRQRGGLNITVDGGLQKRVDKHVAEAEKELDGTLSKDQLRQWADYRARHNRMFFKSTLESRQGGGPARGYAPDAEF